VLNVATRIAYDDVRQSWLNKRLPESLPLLISHKAASLPSEVHENLAADAGAKTRWFDTHPCDSDRARAARRLAQPGVFHLAAPATSLFSAFLELSKTVTRRSYQEELRLEFTEQNLISAEEILRESAASIQTEALVRRFFGGVSVNLKPLLTNGDLSPTAPEEKALKEWREAQALTETLRPEAERTSAECIQQQVAREKFATANILAVAGFELEPEPFGLPSHLVTLSAIEDAARQARNRTTAAIEERLKQLDPFLNALGQRVILALRLSQTTDYPAPAKNTADMAALIAAVGEQIPRAHEIGSQLNAFAALAQNRQNHSRPAQVDEVLAELVQRFQSFVNPMQERLKAFPYPFPHARGQLTVAEYACFEKPADHEWGRAYQDANAHVERLFALHYRLIGQILAIADAAEAGLTNV
jgi:hypothetical protein